MIAAGAHNERPRMPNLERRIHTNSSILLVHSVRVQVSARIAKTGPRSIPLGRVRAASHGLMSTRRRIILLEQPLETTWAYRLLRQVCLSQGSCHGNLAYACTAAMAVGCFNSTPGITHDQEEACACGEVNVHGRDGQRELRVSAPVPCSLACT